VGRPQALSSEMTESRRCQDKSKSDSRGFRPEKKEVKVISRK